VLEWLVVNQLKAEFFWRDLYKNEVDIVLSNKELTPVEIKCEKVNFEGLLAFYEQIQS
jgi:predicted AAA+ superfamily ATPase